jgi:hypothetical protein
LKGGEKGKGKAKKKEKLVKEIKKDIQQLEDGASMAYRFKQDANGLFTRDEKYRKKVGLKKTPAPAPKDWHYKRTFWEDFLDGLDKGFEIGKKIMNVVPFLSNPAHSKPGATVSGSRGMIGVAYSSVRSAPPPPLMRSIGGGMYRFSHRGELGALTSSPRGSTATRGEVLYTTDLTPAVEEWVQRMSAFEKYRFRNVAVTYNPNVPTTVGGKILGLFEWDIDAPLNFGQGEETIRVAMAHQSAAMVDLWTPHTWLFSSRNETKDWWYVDQAGHEPRLTRQGRFTVLAASDMDDADLPVVFGDLTITYEIEFMVPELSSQPSGSYAFYSGATSCTPTNPWGTVIGTADSYDQGCVPAYLVPTNVAASYVLSTTGTYYWNLPAGYWIATYRIVGTTIAGVSVDYQGGYDALMTAASGGSARAYSEINSAGTQTTGMCLFKSNGQVIGGATSSAPHGFTLSLTAAAVSSGFVIFTYLNGSVPYVNPLELKMKMLESEVAAVAGRQQKPTPSASSCSSSSSTLRIAN